MAWVLEKKIKEEIDLVSFEYFDALIKDMVKGRKGRWWIVTLCISFSGCFRMCTDREISFWDLVLCTDLTCYTTLPFSPIIIIFFFLVPISFICFPNITPLGFFITIIIQPMTCRCGNNYIAQNKKKEMMNKYYFLIF